MVQLVIILWTVFVKYRHSFSKQSARNPNILEDPPEEVNETRHLGRSPQPFNLSTSHQEFPLPDSDFIPNLKLIAVCLQHRKQALETGPLERSKLDATQGTCPIQRVIRQPRGER